MAKKGAAKKKAAPATASVGEEAGAAAGEGTVGLVCQKCQQPTALAESCASGRNPLRRNCLGCISTDKWLVRSTQKAKEGVVESDQQKDRRTKANEARECLKNMDPAEKAAWYAAQKEQRAQEDAAKKRSFSSAVGFLQEEDKRTLKEESLDTFETQEDWVARQLLLGRVDSEEEGNKAFKRECLKPQAKTKQRRGETLLWKFRGVECRQGDEHTMIAGKRQRMDISSELDLKDFEDEAQGRLERGQWRLEADRISVLEGAQPTSTNSKLLTVAEDIEKAKAVEKEAEAEWMISLETQAQARKEQKEKKKAEAQATARSVAVELMCLETSLNRAERTMMDALTRHRTNLLAACEEAQSLADHEAMKEECKLHEEACNSILPRVEAAIAVQTAKWAEEAKAVETSTEGDKAEKAHEMVGEIGKELKTWLSKNSEMEELKQALKTWRTLIVKGKAQLRRTNQAAVQSLTSKKVATSNLQLQSMWHDSSLATQAAEAMARDNLPFSDKGLKWNLAKDLLSADASKEASAVCISPDQGLPYAESFCNIDYYKWQKVWVAEQLKKCSQVFLSAMVTKAQVAKKVSTTWAKLLNLEPEMADYLQDLTRTKPGLSELTLPQFWQQSSETCSVHLHPDFGLADIRLFVEGKAMIIGCPMSKLGDSASEARDRLEKISLQEFDGLATWKCSMLPGKCLCIPGDHSYMQVTQSECHGARMHCLAEQSAVRSLRLTTAMMAHNPSLEKSKTGELHAALDEKIGSLDIEKALEEAMEVAEKERNQASPNTAEGSAPARKKIRTDA